MIVQLPWHVLVLVIIPAIVFLLRLCQKWEKWRESKEE